MTTLDPTFDDAGYNTPDVLNVASILSTFCGRTQTEGFQACQHDHRGEAFALVRSVMQTSGVKLLKQILENTKKDAVPRKMIQDWIDTMEADAQEIPAR